MVSLKIQQWLCRIWDALTWSGDRLVCLHPAVYIKTWGSRWEDIHCIHDTLNMTCVGSEMNTGMSIPWTWLRLGQDVMATLNFVGWNLGITRKLPTSLLPRWRPDIIPQINLNRIQVSNINWVWGLILPANDGWVFALIYIRQFENQSNPTCGGLSDRIYICNWQNIQFRCILGQLPYLKTSFERNPRCFTTISV